MSRSLRLLVLGSALALPFLLAGHVLAEGEPAAGGEAKTDKPAEAPKTVEVGRGPFKVTLDLGGTLAPRDASEVRYEPEQYGGALEVLEAVGAGPVVKGQVLVRFSTEEIDRQIESVDADLAIARTAAAKQEEEAKRQEEAWAIQRKQAETEKQRADEALKHFLEIWLPMRKAEAADGLQRSENSLQDNQEELDQLEKMYKADELTEETEDIVLKRTRRNLELQKKGAERYKVRTAMGLDVDLPRELESLVLTQRKEAHEWDRFQATAPLALEQARLEIAKSRLNLRRQEENRAKLSADRDALVVKAPESGLAVPGGFSGGKWQGLDEMTKGLQPGRKVGARAALYTIFKPGALTVVTTVDEGTILKVREGQTGSFVPTAAPDLTLPVTVTSVSRVSSDGKFDLELSLAKSDERLMPGYGGKIKLDVEAKGNALTVPAGAVSKDGEKSVVHVWADGKATARPVKTGATSDGRTEILEGLQPGERVLEKAPKS